MQEFSHFYGCFLLNIWKRCQIEKKTGIQKDIHQIYIKFEEGK